MNTLELNSAIQFVTFYDSLSLHTYSYSGKISFCIFSRVTNDVYEITWLATAAIFLSFSSISWRVQREERQGERIQEDTAQDGKKLTLSLLQACLIRIQMFLMNRRLVNWFANFPAHWSPSLVPLFHVKCTLNTSSEVTKKCSPSSSSSSSSRVRLILLKAEWLELVWLTHSLSEVSSETVIEATRLPMWNTKKLSVNVWMDEKVSRK